MRRSTLHVALHGILSISLAATAALVPLGASHSVIWVCLGVFYLYTAAAIRRPVRFSGGRYSFIKGDLLFLIFAYILFYLPYQLYVVGLDDIWYSRFVRRTFVQYTNPSLLAITAGVVAFCAGVEAKAPNRSSTGGVPKGESRFFVDGFICVTLLLLAGLLGVLVLSGALSTISAGAYSGTKILDRTSDGVYFLTTQFSMLCVAAGLFRRWRFGVYGVPALAALAAAGLWAVLLLVLGDRNNFLLVAIVAACGFSTFMVSVSRLKLLASLVVVLMGYNVIELSRQSSDRGVDAIVQALSQDSEGAFSESSFTNTTVTSRAAFALVPAQYPYFLGRFKAVGFAGVVPYSRGLFVDPNDVIVTSSDLLSIGVLGGRPTWSLGTNVISDIYVDFGYFGIPLLMGLAGFAFGRVLRGFHDSPGSLSWAVLYMMSVALVAELPRYSFDFPARPIAWTLFLLVGYRVVWSLVVKRKR